MTTTLQLHNEALASDGIYQDLQKVIKIGLYRFRAKQLVALPTAAGYPKNTEDRVVCAAIRALIKEQIALLPDIEWQQFAERLFGLTDDTVNQPAKIREQLAGEGLERPRQPSSVRAEGGVRPAVVAMLAQLIGEWANQYNPGWFNAMFSVSHIDFH
jgi:hypothetical protein